METSNHADTDQPLTEAETAPAEVGEAPRDREVAEVRDLGVADDSTDEVAEMTAGDVGNVIDRGDHSISRRSIPENVLKVLYRLHRSGYRAYLCGGSVRDLLMGRTPKDFDVVTDAHPGDVRRLFRNSRIIGRRFRLVHIIFQDQVVEVATFRREPDRAVHAPAADTEVEAEEDFLITDDNTFGSPLQDARRRDFTINAMFYNIADFSVIDYVGGLEDIAEGRVRVIGDPDLRFREDPVRMMRAIEFASRLGFEIEAATYDGILRHRNEILKASAPRVSEEILELLRRGWSRGAIRLMVDTGLLEPLLPEIYNAIKGDRAPYFWKMLEVLDRTVQAGRKISDAVLLSVLVLPWVVGEIEREEEKRRGAAGDDDAELAPDHGDDSLAPRMRLGEVLIFIRDLIQPICARLSLAAGTRHQMEQALETFWRLLEPPSDRRAQFRAVYRDPFNDALALLELYALSSGRYVDVFRQWQAFAVRVKRAQEEVEGTVKKRRRRRRR
ncbi:MAG TPA: polynucleotide adenylyltransferase PcnB [Thermoanaerobaculia bacterium]|nr:polynucleotide adenylyltransferase PcnB [Thermoanaerobaculia bacterium]